MNQTAEKCVYRVEDIQKMLDIGRKQTYILVNEGRFPIKRLGTTIIIP